MPLVVKNPPTDAGDVRDSGLIPERGTPPGEGNGNLLQHSCMENPMDRGAWWATVLGVTESDMPEHAWEYFSFISIYITIDN